MLSKKIFLSLSLLSALATFTAHAGFDDDIKPIYYHAIVPSFYKGFGKIGYRITIQENEADKINFLVDTIKRYCQNSLASIKAHPGQRTIEFEIAILFEDEYRFMDKLMEKCHDVCNTFTLKPLYYATNSQMIVLE